MGSSNIADIESGKSPTLAKSFPEKTMALVNGLPQYFFVLGTLLFFFFHLKPTPNEEGLMQVAKHLYSPGWLPHCFETSNGVSPRFLYQYFAGFLLDHFSFEVVSALGSVMLCVMLAFPLFKIYRLLRITNVGVLLHLPILYFPNQSFFAGEFIFLNFEPKTFAYVFVLLAVYFMLKERYWRATFSGLAATYFHILVGGWFMVYFLLFCLFSKKSLKQTVGQGLIYLVGVLPLLALFATVLSNNFSPSESPVNLDWIYTYFRQPHHTAVFYSMPYFIKMHLDGVLVSLVFFVLSVFIFSRFKNGYNLKINRLNILIFSGTLLCLVAAYFDRTGAFLKFFPFRMNALFTFLTLLQITLASKYFFEKRYSSFFQFGVLAFLLITAVPHQGYGLLRQVKSFATSSQSRPFDEICEYVRLNTPEESVVLLISKEGASHTYSEHDSEALLSGFDMDASFVRKAERRQFVRFKFGAMTPGCTKLYNWYQAVTAKVEVLKNIDVVCTVKEQKRVDFLLTDFELEAGSCFMREYENGAYFLYRLN